MKIVIPSRGPGPDSEMDPRFGRSRFFVIYDTETGDYRENENTENRDAVQGAGVGAVEAVVRLGARCLITDRCGPKAFRALRSAGIRVFYSSGGTVRSTIDKFEAGDLEETDAPNADAHRSLSGERGRKGEGRR